MNDVMDVSAKTVEDAIDKALTIWHVSREAVHIEILEEPKKGLFGIGARDALVRVTKLPVEDIPEPAKPVEEVAPGVAVFNEPEAEEEPAPAAPAKATAEAEPEAAPEVAAAAETEEEEEEDAEAPEEEERNEKGRYFSTEEQEMAAQRGRDFLQSVAAAMGLSIMVEKMVTGERITLHLHGRGLGVLIGKHGKTLNALQYLTNLAANKDLQGHYFIMLDIENYRSRRAETLNALAWRMAEKVKQTRRPVVLEPMSAYERKIIHVALQDDPDVYTRSEGEYQDRHLVIHYRQE